MNLKQALKALADCKKSRRDKNRRIRKLEKAIIENLPLQKCRDLGINV